MSTQTVESKPQEKYFLYACFVMPDGVGDLGHFIDIAKEHGKNDGLESYKPLYIVQYENAEHREQIIGALKDNGFDVNASNFHLVGPDNRFFEEYSDDKVPDNAKTFEHYLAEKKILQEQLLSTPAMLNISTIQFNYHSRSVHGGRALKKFIEQHNKKMACMSIGEHHGEGTFQGYFGGDAQLLKHKFLGVGNLKFDNPKGHKHIGLFIQKLKAPQQKRPDLKAMHNKAFLRTLWGQESPATATDKKEQGERKEQQEFDEKQFLEKTLLIPGYFNREPKMVAQFMSTVANADLTQPFNEYVFVLNKGNTFSNMQDYLEGLSTQIKSIQIMTKEGDKVVKRSIENPNYDPKGKQVTVRVLEGFWLDDHDFDILHQNTQLFAGLSGDKSLERVLSYGEIPLPQIRLYKYELYRNLATMAAEYLPKVLAQEEVELVSQYLKAFVDQKFEKAAEFLKPEFYRQWRLFSDYLYHNHNAYHELPNIKRECLRMAAELQADSAQKPAPDKLKP